MIETKSQSRSREAKSESLANSISPVPGTDNAAGRVGQENMGSQRQPETGNSVASAGINSRATWPSFSIDQRAWELAKVAQSPDDDVHTLIARAQRIKEAING